MSHIAAPLEDIERAILREIANLQRSYHEMAAPLVKRLADISVLKQGGIVSLPLPAPEVTVGPVAFIQRDHLEQAKRSAYLCRVEAKYRDGMGFVPIYTHAKQEQA